MLAASCGGEQVVNGGQVPGNAEKWRQKIKAPAKAPTGQGKQNIEGVPRRLALKIAKESNLLQFGYSV